MVAGLVAGWFGTNMLLEPSNEERYEAYCRGFSEGFRLGELRSGINPFGDAENGIDLSAEGKYRRAIEDNCTEVLVGNDEDGDLFFDELGFVGPVAP